MDDITLLSTCLLKYQLALKVVSICDYSKTSFYFGLESSNIPHRGFRICMVTGVLSMCVLTGILLMIKCGIFVDRLCG